jgi:Cytochrome P450
MHTSEIMLAFPIGMWKAFLASLGLGLVAILLDYVRILRLRQKLPPGPFPLPLVGNHFQTPSIRPWLEWEKWTEHYKSPMITLWIGRHPRIILNDAWTASDLLEKKSDIFSSRPHLIVMGDVINATKTNQTTLPYGDRWRIHRKLMVSFPESLRCKINKSSTQRLAPKPFATTGLSRPMNPRS